MFDAARAVLHVIDDLKIDLPEPILVINDVNGELKLISAKVEFWNPECALRTDQESYKSVILFSPKQREENNYLMALSLKLLKNGGVFCVAAANDAGGKTLAKTMKAFGPEASDHAKHKCRVVLTRVPDTAHVDEIEKAIAAGSMQKRDDGMWTQPGLFSWDHLDKGTDAILHHLPFSLAGRGADFGCGNGILGLRILERYKTVETLICLDRDIRAIVCCQKNLEKYSDRIKTASVDLTQKLELEDLDFIVMNPPFHQGKTQSAAIGKAFIVNAAASLKPGGTLIFVANSHLPYEDSVAQNFSFHRILNENHGFKIIEAIK